MKATVLDQAKDLLILSVAISSCLGKNIEVGQISADPCPNCSPTFQLFGI